MHVSGSPYEICMMEPGIFGNLVAVLRQLERSYLDGINKCI